MRTGSVRRLGQLCGLGLLLLVAATVRADGVAVELLEGPMKDLAWDLEKVRVTERYQEPAFGFVAVPTRYSSKGQALDRSNPFVLRATQTLTLPAGEYRLLLRSRNAARLFLDGKPLVANAFVKPSANGHESVPDLPAPAEAGLRQLLPGQHEKRATLRLDGAAHEFKLEIVIGSKVLRPELGEPVVAIAAVDQPFRILAATPTVVLSEDGWAGYAAGLWAHHRARDAEARRVASRDEIAYWQRRHELARRDWQDRPPVAVPSVSPATPVHNDIDRFIGRRLEERGVTPAPLTEDEAFLRRVTLDTVGVIPTVEEIDAFRHDLRPDRRARVIDRLLADPRWADHWVSYWQDVLAENPGLLKPTLNNTGPFRWWLHQALLDNLPMDRFATELAMMEGSFLLGGPAGFAVATENDVPMAAKAQTLARAFLAADLTCARCHDAPMARSFKQQQLFSLAALLNQAPLKVPATSSVKQVEGARVPAVKVTLKPGTAVAPDWQLDGLASENVPAEVLRTGQARERAAAILTSPRNERFAQVLANRVWHRYLGVGLVDPVDDWRDARALHPELLAYLGRELITHAYDLKHVARLILNSHTYQRTLRSVKADRADRDEPQLFAAPSRRRLSAEQLVDSLFVAAGKEFGCEELNFDPDGRQPLKQCLNLGVPRRAWQFVSLSNERDRPALALPIAQTFVDVLTAYGWRDARTASLTVRDESASPLQPLVLANGVLGNRVARLSDDSAFTALALEERPLPELVRRVCERVLSRRPTAEEESLFVELLRDGYEQRRTGAAALPKVPRRTAVSWANHLSPEATRMKLELERVARAGDPPSPRLRGAWRERLEDMIWSLMNAPEFVFVP